MASVDERIKQAKNAGYEVLDNFTLSKDAWRDYFKPLQERVDAIKAEMTDSPAIADIEEELTICRDYSDEFGYQMFVLRKVR